MRNSRIKTEGDQAPAGNYLKLCILIVLTNKFVNLPVDTILKRIAIK